MSQIIIYGDSHAKFCFANLNLKHVNKCQFSVTMHRIGRDEQIVNFESCDLGNGSNVFVFLYGEIDCRCHIGRQVCQGVDVDLVIDSLVISFFKCIANHIKQYSLIIVCAVPPPTSLEDYNLFHDDSLTHDFPFIGSDPERVSYTNKMNEKLEIECSKHNFIFFDPFNMYKNENGTLNQNFSDKCVHIENNSGFLSAFEQLLSQT